MSKSKVISVGIAVDLQNTQEISSQIQGMSKDLANMKLDKDLEPRLKNVEKTLAGAVKQISAMTDKIDVLSKAGGLDPKTLSDLSMLATAIADVKVEVDALSSRMNNFSKQLSNVGDIGVKQVAGNITKEIGNMTTGIDASLNNAAKSIQAGGEKLKKSYEKLLTSLQSSIDKENFDVSKIFKFKEDDEYDDKLDKVKDRIDNDLSELSRIIQDYNNLKITGANENDVVENINQQIKALDRLKQSVIGFLNIQEFDMETDEYISDKAKDAVEKIQAIFPELKNIASSTFDDLGDLVDNIFDSIQNNIKSNLNNIETSIGEIKKFENKTNNTRTEQKKTNKHDNEKDVVVGIKEGTGAELISELKAVINDLQKYVDKNPIELDAIINPSWGTTQTQKYLKSIKEQLAKTKNGKIDEGLAERIYGLQDAFGKDFSDALNKSISKLKDSLSKDGFSVGKLKIEDSAIKNFREQLSNELGAVPINVNANIIEGKNQSEEINKQFEELEALDKIDPNKIMQLVNAIKETGATLDYSDLYKNRLKQIVKGLVDGIYGSVPEAIKKTKYPNGANPLIGEFNDNSRRIKELSSKIQGGASDKSLSFYNQQLESLIKRQKEILGELSQNVEGVSESVAEEIKDAVQKIDAATIEVGTATINIANADTTFTNANIASITSKSEIKTTQETSKTSKESKKDKKVDNVQNAEQKVANANVNITDAKVNTTNKNQETKSIINEKEDSKRKEKNEKLTNDFWEHFKKKIYSQKDIKTYYKSPATRQNIQKFVYDVINSGIDKFVIPKTYQDNAVGQYVYSLFKKTNDPRFLYPEDVIENKQGNELSSKVLDKTEDATQTVKNAATSTRDELVALANKRFHELLSNEFNDNLNFEDINTFVKDLRKAGITEFGSPKAIASSTTGRIIDTMLKNGYDDALQAFKSTTSSSEESKAKAQEAQQMSKLFQRFKKLYDMQTVQEKGLGSELSIKRFVDDVRKSGYDFKVAPQYQNNEIGKLINTMLTENKKTVAEATGESTTTKTTQQNIDKATININTATVNIKGTENIANAKQTISSATINVKKGISNTNNEKKTENNKDVDPNVEKLIKQYNKNIDNSSGDSLIKFLNKQEKILSSILNYNNHGDSLEDIASEQYNDKPRGMIFPRNISEDAKNATKNIHKTLKEIKSINAIYDYLINDLNNDIDTSKEMHFHITRDRNNNKIYQNRSAITTLKSNTTKTTPVNAYTTETVHNHPSGIVLPSYADLISNFTAILKKVNEVNYEKKRGNYSNTFDEFSSSIIDFGSGKLSTINYSDFLNQSPDEIQAALKDTIIKSLAAQFLSRVNLQDNNVLSFNDKNTQRLLRGSFLNKITGDNFSIYERNENGEYTDVTNKELIPLTEAEIQKLNEVFKIIEEIINNLGVDISDKKELNKFIDSNIYAIASKAIKNNAIFSNEELNKLYNGSDFFNEKAQSKMPFQSILDKYIISSDMEEDVVEDDSTQLHNGIKEYITKIDDIIASTTDETLKGALQVIRNELIENGQMLLTAMSETDTDSAQIRLDAIQGLKNGISNLDIISEGLNQKAKEIDSFLKSIESINEIIGKGEDKNLSKAAQDTIKKSKERIEELKETFNTAQKNNNYSEIDTESIVEELNTLQNAVGEAINETVVDKLDVKGLIRKLDNLQINEVKTDPAVMSRVKELRRQLQEVANDDAREVLTEEYKSWSKEISQLTGTVSKSDRTFFGNFMKEWRHKNYQMLAQFFSFYDIIRYMREAVTVVKQYDSALIEMMKVSDETRYSLERYQQTLFDTADAIGSSALTLEQSTADWMRIGESLTEAAESAKAAQILMNVSEFQDINSATQALVSASQAYAELDKMEIVDKINKLGNEFPIATDQLATALQNSAAALTTQGNDLNEALALVVGGNVITQDALKTGTGIRTIALRIAGTKEAKDELAELGEGVDDFVVRTESKTRKLIMDYTAVASNGFKGVDIYNENGNLRSTYEIMQDIADIYKEIQLEDRQAGTNRANALVELLAGKNRSNIAASILTNPDTIREAYEAAQNAEGSAMRENEKYLTSVEAHMTMFKNAVDELITSLVDSGFINDVIDFGTTLINGLKEITDLLGGVGTALAGLGIGVAAKSHVFTDKNYGILNAIKTIANQPLDQDALMKLYAKTSSPEELMSQIAGRGLTSRGAKFLEMNKVTKDVEGLEKAIVSTEDATMSLGSAWTTIGFSIAAIVGTVIITAIAKYAQEIREAQKAARDFAKETQNQNKSLDEYAKKIAEANKIINDERSSTDEIRNAKNDLIDIQNELNESYNNFSTVIQNANDSLKEENALLIANRQEKIKDAIYEAKNAKSAFTDSEYNTAIKAFEGKYLSYAAQGLSRDILLKYGGNRLVAKEGAEGAFEFITTGNKDDDIRILSQIRDSIPEEDENSLDAINTLTELINSIEESRDTYRDIYLAYGENLAGDKFDKQYQSLMTAYYNDLELNTDESEQILKDRISELWDMASDETDAGIRYWLNSMFQAYISEINKIDFNDETITAANNLKGSSNNGRRGNSFKELSYEDILNGLNGRYAGNIDATQKKYIEELRTQFINAGITDYNAALDQLGMFEHEAQLSLEKDIEEARKTAIANGMSAEDFDKLGINTDKELTKWIEITKATSDAKEQIKAYALAMSGLEKALDASTMLKNMETQYRPVFNSMAEAYKAIWSTDGFDVGAVTSEQIQSINSQIESLDASIKEAGGEGFDTDAVNEFILTLSNANATEKEVQDAFNNIATILVDSLNPALSQASGETAELMQKTLTELGVTNAEKVVMSRLGYTMETYAAAKEAAAEVDIDIDKELGAFTDEELITIATTEALSEYYNARILANSLDIQTSDDVKNLINLCDQLDISIDKIQGLAEAKKKLAYVETLEAQLKTATTTDQVAALEKQLKSAQADLDSYLERVEVKYESEVDINPEYDGNTAKSSSTSSSKSDSKQKFDWIERAIKKIQRAVTNLGKVADATYKTWGERLDAIMGKTEEFHDEIGQFGRGNIDLYNRPQYINEDGSVSTVRSMSFGDEYGNEILVPTIAFDSNGNPYSMSDDEAIARYYETGEYLGLFKSIEEAEEYAEKLHKQQEAIYADGGDKFYAGKYQKLKEEIALQEQAAQAYMAEANAIGLSAEYRSKVMNGLMDIETVTNEKLKEQISDFQEYYDKATDAADAVEDLRGEIAQLAQTKFDNITKQFEEMALAIDHAANRIGSIQNKIASEGYFESTALIKQLKAGNEEKLGQLKQEAQALAASIDEAVTNGDIAYGSEQWWGMYDALQNVNDQIVEMGATIADLNDQLRQLEWDKFDYIANAVNRLTEENNFLIDVLKGEELMFEKIAYIGEDLYANGNMSDAALAVQGLHVNNLQILQKQNETYAEEIKKINKELANDPNNKKILERRNDLIDQQQDIIKGIDDEKHAIKDLIQEGYETFLDYLQKSIDKRKEALEAQKSLYDYENTVAEQTKAIASYQKQISALGGDDSEETQARLQELANNLNAAEKELQQTEYEQWLSDQEKMMDNMYNSFEKLINDRLDDLDGLVEQAIQQTADSAVGISQTIQTEADEFLYELDNTSFGMNIDARMSDVIGVVNNVENAINNMITAANVNASNELAQLQALAATVATQAAVNAAQRQAQINVTPSSSSSNSANATTTTTQKPKVDNSEQISKLNDQLRELERLYDYNIQMNSSYLGRANKAKDANTYNELVKKANEFGLNATKYKKQITDLQNKIKNLKAGAYTKGGTIGRAIKKTGEDGIILARSGEEVLSLERVKQMQGIFKMMQPLTAMNSKTISNLGGSTTVNGMNVSFALPNVTSYEDFVQKAKSDPTFEKIVQSMTIGTSLGKNKLSKYSL